MSRPLVAVIACVLFAALLSAAPAPTEPSLNPIDLKEHINVKLKDSFHAGTTPGNDLAPLPTGKQTLAGVKFTIGDGVVQLGSARVKDKPEKVEGIKVGRFLTKLHVLHSCGCGYATEDSTVIGKYVVHYDDKTTEDIEIVYGKDVVDWWVAPDRKAPTRSKVGWEGENEAVKGSGTKIKLSLTTWENPHPKKKVVSLDYVATAATTDVAPFCVAITAEDK
ncbi:MAG TPA: hypothetical protein VKA46_22720 [Gemmataceae bacterium]|nr:hypothetical protein [Gemmataceae bacterium]